MGIGSKYSRPNITPNGVRTVRTVTTEFKPSDKILFIDTSVDGTVYLPDPSVLFNNGTQKLHNVNDSSTSLRVIPPVGVLINGAVDLTGVISTMILTDGTQYYTTDLSVRTMSTKLTENRKIRHLAGVIRGDGSNDVSAWTYMSSIQRSSIGFTAITCDTGKIRVTWPTASKLLSFVAIPNNVLVDYGYTLGVSAYQGYADIQIRKVNALVTGYITGSNSSDVTAYTFSQERGITDVTYMSASGLISITHDPMGTTYLGASIVPRVEMGATRPVYTSMSDTKSYIKILNGDGSIRTGAASVNDRFVFSRFNPLIVANPKTLYVPGGPTIYLFAVVED